MKGSSFLFLVVWAASCQSEESPSINPVQPSQSEIPQTGDLESRARRHAEAQLQIPVNEQYRMHLYRAHLDPDGKEDGVITVNRLNHALYAASKDAKAAKLAEIGFMGNHNIMFFYDGGLDKISNAIAIPSSPYLPLDIAFASITNPAYQDILVTYRIRNSGFRTFFTIINHMPSRFFEWPEFDGIGTPNAEAFAFEFVQTARQSRKNIQIYAANIYLSDTVKNYYIARPKIIKSPMMLREFFYLPAKQAYVTKK
ncbi:MAG: hypothetical protein FJZ80_00020 [Bacteroidetes bacterium]|nr:hypothetical protein [Bacteroidota bacterium]MBM3423962.1 hypothetical protein [Bacteroidota bacterium]